MFFALQYIFVQKAKNVMVNRATISEKILTELFSHKNF